jgi:hypothetical protein
MTDSMYETSGPGAVPRRRLPDVLPSVFLDPSHLLTCLLAGKCSMGQESMHS